MKSLAFLLPLALALLLHSPASAQDLVRSSFRLGAALDSLNGEVQSRLDKSEGRKDGQHAVEQARIASGQVYNQASTGQSRGVVGNSIIALRNSIAEVQREMGKHRDRNSIQDALANVNVAMTQVNNAWANYGFAAVPPPRAAGFDDRAAGLAARAIADNLRVPVANVAIVQIDRAGQNAHVVANVRGAGRYAVDLNAATWQVFSMKPIR